MTDVSARPVPDPLAGAAAPHAAVLLTIEHAASEAGCTHAYLAECIALGQLEQSSADLVDEALLMAWMRQSLRPQQLALRAIVDAIDVMEKRSMKPVVDGGSTDATSSAELDTTDRQHA